MNMKIVLAGAASALLVGSFAVAQTNQSTGSMGATNDTTQSGSMQSGAVNNQSATGAGTYGTDTAGQTGADTGTYSDTAMAGERG